MNSFGRGEGEGQSGKQHLSGLNNVSPALLDPWQDIIIYLRIKNKASASCTNPYFVPDTEAESEIPKLSRTITIKLSQGTYNGF